MIRSAVDGLVFYEFESLAGHAAVRHAVFTRLGGQSRGAFQLR